MSENLISGLKDFSFPKKEKLKNKKLFEQLFTDGKGITVFPIKLLFVPTQFENDIDIKVAVVAPKKKFKSAVKRNRIKRLLREAYRLNKHLVFNNIEGNFAFLFLYLGKKMPTSKEMNTAMKKLLEDFLKKESDEKNS